MAGAFSPFSAFRAFDGALRTRSASITSQIAALFASGEQGALYDVTDTGALFRDALGVFPAGRSEPVGRVADKSGNGLAATQISESARGVLTDGAAIFFGVGQSLSVMLPDLGADATVAYAIPGVGAQITTGQTIGAGPYSITQSFAALVIINRALTAAETAGLTRWLDRRALQIDALQYDYYIDASAGNDANDGLSRGTAWATLSKLSDINLQPSDYVRVAVMAGTYATADDYIHLAMDGVSSATIEITFAFGCVIDGTNVADSVNGVEASGNQEWNLVLIGNGLTIKNFSDPTAASPNGVGNRGKNIIYAYNVHIENCDDGFSAHADAKMYLYDCSASGCEKGAFVHTDNAYFEAHRCTFTERVGGGSLGFGGSYLAGVRQKFYDCVFIPDTDQGMQASNSEFERCQVGTLAKRVRITTGYGGVAAFSRCFMNAWADGNAGVSLAQCFGKFSARVRSGGSGIAVDRSVIAGPATSQPAVVFANFDGGGSKFSINNNIFPSGTFDSLSNSTYAGYLMSAGSEFHNNILHGGPTYSALLTGADSGGQVAGTITDNPLVGAANTVRMEDYAFAVGSPAEGAGVGGVDIGFGAADVEERRI